MYEGLCFSIYPLSTFNGEIYSSQKEPVKELLIEHPRAIVLRDGRIYVERNFKDFDPWKSMPEIIKTSREFFMERGIWSPTENDIRN